MNTLPLKRMTRCLVTTTLAFAALSHGQQARAQNIIPFISEVETDLNVNGSTIIVHYGYMNLQSFELFITVNPGAGANFFLPNSDSVNANRGQPTQFLPGLHRRAFQVPGTAGETITWQIQPGVQAIGSVENLSGTIPVLNGIASISGYDDGGVRKTYTYFHNDTIQGSPYTFAGPSPAGGPTLRVEDDGVLQMQSKTLQAGAMVVGDDGLVVATGGLISINQTLIVESGGTMQTIGGGLSAGLVSVEAGGRWTGIAGALGGGDTYNVGSGLVNSGQIDLSGVTIQGDVSNGQDAVINLLGDVVFTGLVSGPGGFFGSGTATFNGGYAPGASPAVVEHENNVVFGDTNTLEIELAGLALGEFDRLEILQDLDIDGLLDVTLIDGFTLGLNQQFEILDVDGTTTGQFIGLSEGDLVNTFGGIDLFISYTAGDGNDVALYTVPEPTSLAMLGLGGLLLARRRKA